MTKARSFLLFLTAFLIIGSLTRSIPARQHSASLTVQVLVSSGNSYYTAVLAGLQSQIKSPIQIQYMDQMDRSQIVNFLREYDERGADFFITLGPLATRTAMQELEKTPVLYGAVDLPYNLDPQISRHCGVSTEIPETVFQKIVHEIRPDLQHIYVLYNTPAGLQRAIRSRMQGSQAGVYYHLLKTRSGKNPIAVLKNQIPAAQAIRLVQDTYLDQSTFKYISNYSKENKVILMTEFPALVRSGATFGIQMNRTRAGARVAQLANRIRSGSIKCKHSGILYLNQYSFYINENYIKAQGFVLSKVLVNRAHNTELLQAGINLYHKGHWVRARKLLGLILENDPQNQQALQYRQLSLEKSSGIKLDLWMDQADLLMKKKQPDRAGQIYRRVLAIYPGHAGARQGRHLAAQAISKRYRKRARIQMQNGQPFPALLNYRKAVTLDPKNGQARQEFSALQARLRGQVGSMMVHGTAAYSRRDYVMAIKGFKNILLVEPGHKRAREYLKLSERKKAALEKLKSDNQG